ncbi:MAG: GGDEF domain-containing protein [Desulfohalobiaceae bacterium]|nr:GGDEF domain-containing protein [Desulfohalobiaceae bacterium]
MDVLDNLTKKIDHLEEFPALPGVALKILEKIKDPNAPLCQLAEILATDPPLSAKVLMLVNSPYFGLRRKITNLPHAVNLLGEESLKYIALSFSLINLLGTDKKFFNYSLFWKESLTCAVICRLMAKDLDLPDAEDYYFLGLIHNIGKLALVRSYPRQYALVMDKVKKEGAEFHVAENEVLGCNHMEAGACLVNSWGLPEDFSLPILYHHYPHKVPDEHVSSLFRARIVSLSFEICLFLYADDKVLRLSMIKDMLQEYELAESIRLESLLQRAMDQITPLVPLFDLKLNTELDYLQILEDSKKELVKLSSSLTRKVKEQREQIATLSTLATQDGLTGLRNYQSFQDALDRELAGCQRYAHSSVLALADLDAFKSVNDGYGHLAGDRVLQEIARFFSENIRKSDIVARYGGEEFVFILSRTSVNAGLKILDRLRESLSRFQVEYRGQRISVSMSVGVTSFSSDATSKDELLRQADAAMYQAKNKGGNRTRLFRPFPTDGP